MGQIPNGSPGLVCNEHLSDYAVGGCNGAKLGVDCVTKEGNFLTILLVLLCVPPNLY